MRSEHSQPWSLLQATGRYSPCKPSTEEKPFGQHHLPRAPNYDDLIEAGFLLEESGTDTYWSNQKTMQNLVNKILAPYFDTEKTKLSLPSSQRSMWSIDVWSVHRSEEFKDWVNSKHPTIILDYIPGGCTGVAQPCNVGIQRPFKLSIKRSYHEDVISEILGQLDSGAHTLSMDNQIGTMCDRSARWLWKVYKMSS